MSQDAFVMIIDNDVSKSVVGELEMTLQQAGFKTGTNGDGTPPTDTVIAHFADSQNLAWAEQIQSAIAGVEGLAPTTLVSGSFEGVQIGPANLLLYPVAKS